MKMDWRLKDSDVNAVDEHGIGGFLKRLEMAAASGGGSLKGFRFLQDASEMLRFTREIEGEIINVGASGPLYVGFQNAGKLEKEAGRYRRMRANGVTVYGFGEGDPPNEWVDGLADWTALEPDHSLLQNQWLLVTTAPRPIAFVGWEVSPDEIWGRGGISSSGKTFTGFVSDDERAVAAILAHFEGVRLGRASDESSDGQIADLIRDSRPRRIMALADEGERPFLTRALPEISEAGGEIGADIYLYDLSAASYLVSPYPDDDDRWKKPQTSQALRRALGRSALADEVEAASAGNAKVKGILPYKVGFGHLLEWCAREAIDTVVVPVEFTQPSLIERLQGISLQTLTEQKSNVTIIVDDPVRGPWMVPVAQPVRDEARAAR